MKTRFYQILATAFVFSFALLPSAVAGDGGEQDSHKVHHPNRHVALFVGTTSVDGHGYFTVGGDFSYRIKPLNERVSVLGLVDAAFGDHPHTIVGGGFALHPGYNLKVLVAPSVEFKEGHHKVFVRTGVGVDFHYNHVSFSPVYNVDYIDGHAAHVYGIAVGYSF